tara:strand:- start:182 stop:679 length:498 start_codon:yes stop_codon:yes gene_type:complete
MSKNIQKVQDMVDGNYKSKIQSGYTKTEEHRKVGDKWVDSDGNHWEQRDGYKTKNTSNIRHHSWDKKCSGCEKLILKDWDKDTYKADGRCYHCQLNYELDLQFEAPIRWFAYRRLKDFKNMKSIEKDMEQWIDEKQKLDKEKIFDMSVANAMANENVSMNIKKNT